MESKLLIVQHLERRLNKNYHYHYNGGVSFTETDKNPTTNPIEEVVHGESMN